LPNVGLFHFHTIREFAAIKECSHVTNQGTLLVKEHETGPAEYRTLTTYPDCLFLLAGLSIRVVGQRFPLAITCSISGYYFHSPTYFKR